MDPARYGDWVTIHRRLGHVDSGELREGFEVEQTLALHHANFKVRWSLAELRRAAARRLGGARARPARTPGSSTSSSRSTAAAGRASTTSTSTRSPAVSSGAWRAGCWSPASPSARRARSLERLKAFVETAERAARPSSGGQRRRAQAVHRDVARAVVRDRVDGPGRRGARDEVLAGARPGSAIQTSPARRTGAAAAPAAASRLRRS